jgi:hypothetical protein
MYSLEDDIRHLTYLRRYSLEGLTFELDDPPKLLETIQAMLSKGIIARDKDGKFWNCTEFYD